MPVDATIQLAESDLHVLDQAHGALFTSLSVNPLATIQLADSDLHVLGLDNPLPPLLPRAWAPLEVLAAEQQLRRLLRRPLFFARLPTPPTTFWTAAGAAVGFCALAWLAWLLCGSGPVPGFDLTPTASVQPPAAALTPAAIPRVGAREPAPTQNAAPARDIPAAATPAPAAPARATPAARRAVKATPHRRTARPGHRRGARSVATADAILASTRTIQSRRAHIVRRTVDPFEE